MHGRIARRWSEDSMITRGSLWLPLAILLLLAALSFWIERVGATDGQRQRRRPKPILKASWKISMRCAPIRQATRTTACPPKSSSIIPAASSPNWNRPASSSWTPRPARCSAVAKQATVSSDGNEVDLRGDVHGGTCRPSRTVRHDAAHGTAACFSRARPAARAGCDRYPSTAPWTVRAGAMEYNAKQRVIKLTGRVKARYISGRK